jgi:DNA mismatch repair protein MSH6
MTHLHILCSGENGSSKSVVKYEDTSKRLLQEFTAALRGCQQMFQACSSLRVLTGAEGSCLLNDLLSPGSNNNFPY